MNSIKDRVREVSQPEGGYLSLSEFTVFDLGDGLGSVRVEGVPAAWVSRAVDGLARMRLEGERADVFYKYMRGASRAEDCGRKGSIRSAKELKDGIVGLDDESVLHACQLASFGDWSEDPAAAEEGPDWAGLSMDKASTAAVRTMAERMGTFFDKYGQPENRGFSFEPADGDSMGYVSMTMGGTGRWGGYTVRSASGCGDFMTEDTMWLVKSDGSEASEDDTLELLMWMLMGAKSGQAVYGPATKAGIFEPGTGRVYLLNADAISADVLEAVSEDVLGYVDEPVAEDAEKA